MSSSNENIDRLAQSFFLVLIFCSLLSDSYIMLENFIKNDYVRKKLNYCKKVSKVLIGLSFNNYKKDDEGNIIIENDDNKQIISDDSDDEIEQISEEINDLMKDYSNNKNPFDEDIIVPDNLQESIENAAKIDYKSIYINNKKVLLENNGKSIDNKVVLDHEEDSNNSEELDNNQDLNSNNEDISNSEELNDSIPIEINKISQSDISIKKREKKVKKEVKETIIKKNNTKLNENILNKKAKSSKVNQS
jgi:hypothetical protein